MLEPAKAFKALTGHHPLRWQHRLYEMLSEGRVPRVCSIPTGLGKTSIIPLWLIALAVQAQRVGQIAASMLPRRLIYIVNRRTVVDQATDVAGQMRGRLLDRVQGLPEEDVHILRQLREALRRLAGDPRGESVLAISTLRGELADNQEWKINPARPAIVIGTIDMIGSKLLFSGYGDSVRMRPHHAGLLGQDALIVHDEAHLTPAFSQLLRTIEEVQRQARELRPIRVLELSATPAAADASNGRVFSLADEDANDPWVRVRLEAVKELHIHSAASETLVDRLTEKALAHDGRGAKVLIYVRSPETTRKVLERLKNRLGKPRKHHVALLTGTIRGYERDRLVKENPVYRALLGDGSAEGQSMYLVSTSAGEVGIDLDADHMVCDLTTLDAMIQRLGRVNRRGKGEARIDVVVEEPRTASRRKQGEGELDQALGQTLSRLKQLPERNGGGRDAGPWALARLLAEMPEQARLQAFAPQPACVLPDEITLDAWSLTSIRGAFPIRQEVAPYLHGLTNDPPETYVVWRAEISLFAKADLPPEEVETWFDLCPVSARERLRDRTDRVQKTLQDLLKAHRKGDAAKDFQAVVLNERGEAQWWSLSDIVKKENQERIAFRTVVLPVEAGGLGEEGMLDPKAVEPITNIDVVEEATGDDRRERWLHISDGIREWYENLLTGQKVDSLPGDLNERGRIVLQEAPESAEEEGESCSLLLMAPSRSPDGDPERTKVNQTLSDHTHVVVDYAERIAEALGIDLSLKEALRQAAKWHDRGKARRLWQRFAGNPNPTEPLAKSARFLPGRLLGGYRHEFGSLLEAVDDDGISHCAEADLILHLIAAHHGWARPHFELRAFDHERFSSDANRRGVEETMRRFGRLQQRFGRWGLAWVESLLRCADILASRHAADNRVARAQEIRA